tara:strand:+ start:3561 stop:3803 length:243 start_codon:yes stop_codon:yes gene_type:complete
MVHIVGGSVEFGDAQLGRTTGPGRYSVARHNGRNFLALVNLGVVQPELRLCADQANCSAGLVAALAKEPSVPSSHIHVSW